MTPKEKAFELVQKMRVHSPVWEIKGDAKECALIAVDEIVKSENLNYLFTKEQLSCMEFTSDDRWIHETFIEYWEEVKQEIESYDTRNI